MGAIFYVLVSVVDIVCNHVLVPCVNMSVHSDIVYFMFWSLCVGIVCSNVLFSCVYEYMFVHSDVVYVSP